MTVQPINKLSRAAQLPLVGSELAFDFTNTSSGREGPRYQEHFRSGGDIVAWARHARVLSPADAERLERALQGDAALVTSLLERAVELRDIVYRIGAACAARQIPPEPDIDHLARVHAACVARAKLAPHNAGFVWAWDPAAAPVEAILGPVALSTLTLLTQSDLGRIKQCNGDHCGWLFLDTTKNKSRRWCEMEVCGNRAKQKRRRGAAQ